jgi:C-terminal processing protease CtpA/Prc
MRRRLAPPLVALALLGAAGPAPAAGERGDFGFIVHVETEGFFLDPTLRTITVEKVVPDSPAAKKGVLVGDQVVEVEGLVVDGRKVKEIAPLVEKTVGEALRLRLRRPSGEQYRVEIVAARKPGDS